MLERLEGNWISLGTVTFGGMAVLAAWGHETSLAIVFSITAALCVLARSRS